MGLTKQRGVDEVGFEFYELVHLELQVEGSDEIRPVGSGT